MLAKYLIIYCLNLTINLAFVVAPLIREQKIPAQNLLL